MLYLCIECERVSVPCIISMKLNKEQVCKQILCYFVGSYDGLGQRRRAWPSGDLDLTPEMRQRNVQEKNRLAQRRFRERQKAKVQDLHSQIGDLKSEVGVLLVQNTALSSQNKILEKVGSTSCLVTCSTQLYDCQQVIVLLAICRMCSYHMQCYISGACNACRTN